MADDTKIDYVTRRLDVVAEKISDMNTELRAHAAKFDAHVDVVHEQRDELKRNTEILNNNTASLQDHIRRTDLLEDYVKRIDDRFTPLELENLRRKAIRDWSKNSIIFLAKFGGAITALGAIAAIAKLVLQFLTQ